MKKYLFFLLGIINVHLAFSQVSGYMGKRFLLESYNMATTNFFTVFWLRKDDGVLGAFSPGIQVEYALGRSSSISASYHYYSQSARVVFPKKVSWIDKDKYSIEYSGAMVRGHSLGLNYRYYLTKKNTYWGLAPIGNYIGIGVGCYTGVSINTKGSSIAYTSPKLDTKPFLRIEIGSRNILNLSNKMLFQLERATLNYGICYTPLFRKDNPNDFDVGGLFDNYSISEIDAYNLIKMDNSLKFANSFTANVGIGLFLF